MAAMTALRLMWQLRTQRLAFGQAAKVPVQNDTAHNPKASPLWQCHRPGTVPTQSSESIQWVQ